jgi:glyoxylase-like metal-dependent hydrolase (beta-lactamase superfamily II)
MLTVGSLFTNCYVVWCEQTGGAAVIDPGFDHEDEAEKVLGAVREKGLKVELVIDTHGHPDHTCGNGVVKDATGASIVIHELDADMLGKAGARLAAFFGLRTISPVADGFLVDGNTVRFGRVGLRALHTPGHSPGSVCLVGDNCVFSGDTLFAGSVGRVDLPGGSGVELLRSLRERLTGLPDGFVVYPGHGPKSTIGEEKRCNPFLQEEFDASLFE